MKAQRANQGSGMRLKIPCRILVVDIDEAFRECLSIVIHQLAIANVVPRHFLLLVGMQIGIGEQLFEAGEAGVHWPSNKMHDPRIGQRGENQRQVQVVHRQLVDKPGRFAPHTRARLKVHIANGARIRLGGGIKERC